jgi:hypothetical protein
MRAWSSVNQDADKLSINDTDRRNVFRVSRRAGAATTQRTGRRNVQRVTDAGLSHLSNSTAQLSTTQPQSASRGIGPSTSKVRGPQVRPRACRAQLDLSVDPLTKCRISCLTISSQRIWIMHSLGAFDVLEALWPRQDHHRS